MTWIHDVEGVLSASRWYQHHHCRSMSCTFKLLLWEALALTLVHRFLQTESRACCCGPSTLSLDVLCTQVFGLSTVVKSGWLGDHSRLKPVCLFSPGLSSTQSCWWQAFVFAPFWVKTLETGVSDNPGDQRRENLSDQSLTPTIMLLSKPLRSSLTEAPHLDFVWCS